MVDSPEITPLLERAHGGDAVALDQVTRLVHGDLGRIARRVLAQAGARGRVPLTLEPAALVNETFVRLLEQRKRLANREHLFAIATRIMLRVLADYRRSKNRGKRGGQRVHLSLSALERKGASAAPIVEAAFVAAELEKLEALDSRAGRVAKLRVIWGLELEEVAKILGVSRSTVDRDWRFARSWLVTRL